MKFAGEQRHLRSRQGTVISIVNERVQLSMGCHKLTSGVCVVNGRITLSIRLQFSAGKPEMSTDGNV